MSGDLCAALKEFADNLAPSQSLVSEAGRIISRLAQHLHSDRFKWHRSINRIVPLGSYAKKTSLRFMMDLDLVVYLNDCDYPFEDFLNDLEDHIMLHDSYKNCSKKGLTCLSFIAEGSLHVDLLPAKNRVPQHEDSRGMRAHSLQYENTMEFIKSSENPTSEGRKQSTALSETAVEFVKRKNQQFHCSTMARLAKFWSKTVCIEGFHFGRSSIMEYIAISSTEEEQRSGRENTLKSFRRFLTKVTDPKQMSIFWTEYYSAQEIPPRTKRSRPLLLDPTNPYNNMLQGVKYEAFMMEMATFARVSLERLDEAKCRGLRGEAVDLPALFRPQPEWLRLPVNLRPSNKPRNIYVNVKDGDGLMMPKTVFKARSMDENDREVIENFLFSFSEVTISSSKKKGIRNVADKVQRDIQRMIAPEETWGPGNEPTNRDAKIQIPFVDDQGMPKVLNVSFDMK